MLGALLLAGLLAAAAASGAEPSAGAAAAPAPAAADGPERAGPANVLVLLNEDSADADRDGRADDLQVAEYYAARRGVPAENLLGVRAGKDRRLDYRVFFSNVLTPLAAKLAARAADGRPFSERILYIAVMPGMPVLLDTHHGKAESPFAPGYGAGARSLDQWLISAGENLAAGVDEKTGKPGRTGRAVRLGEVLIGRKPLDQVKHGEATLGQIPVAGTKLGAIVPAGEGRLGDLVHDGVRLGDVPVGGEKLDEIEVGTEQAPLRLGDVRVDFMHLGAFRQEVLLPVLNAFVGPQPTSFRQLRARDPKKYGFCLVTRLGLDPASARRCVDGALHAERYLRGGGGAGTEAAGPRLAIWLDQKFQFAGDQVAAQANCAALVQSDRLFRPGAAGPLSPWPLVIDCEPAEIGMPLGRDGAGSLHRPTARAKVAAVEGNFVRLQKQRIGKAEAPMSHYFPPGWEVTLGAGPAKAAVKAVDVAGDRLELSSVEGLKAGDELVAVWPGSYPAKDCFYFFGFYGLGRYEDVFAFPPGAVGIHVDSSCMSWARGALGRGIAGTFGVTVEPFSCGIPYGDRVLAALGRGNDLAEAMTGGLYGAQRWAGVIFGDPLYAPFRGAKLPDRTAPVMEKPTATVEPKGVRVAARLGGASPDELADVALFRVEWGPDAKYGQALDFYEWPEPEKSKCPERDYSGYSRFCSRLVTGIEKGRTWHYRVVARDLAGNETASPDGTFEY